MAAAAIVERTGGKGVRAGMMNLRRLQLLELHEGTCASSSGLGGIGRCCCCRLKDSICAAATTQQCLLQTNVRLLCCTHRLLRSRHPSFAHRPSP